jgi:hypothetical protein
MAAGGRWDNQTDGSILDNLRAKGGDEIEVEDDIMDQALSIMTEMQLNLDSVGLSNSISSSEFGKKKKC